MKYLMALFASLASIVNTPVCSRPGCSFMLARLTPALVRCALARARGTM